jgi:hypothetical protein
LTKGAALKGTITIALTTEIPDSGSGMPDLGHDAYWLMKEIPKLTYKDTNGKMRPMSDKYAISSVRTKAHPSG